MIQLPEEHTQDTLMEQTKEEEQGIIFTNSTTNDDGEIQFVIMAK